MGRGHNEGEEGIEGVGSGPGGGRISTDVSNPILFPLHGAPWARAGNFAGVGIISPIGQTGALPKVRRQMWLHKVWCNPGRLWCHPHGPTSGLALAPSSQGKRTSCAGQPVSVVFPVQHLLCASLSPQHSLANRLSQGLQGHPSRWCHLA